MAILALDTSGRIISAAVIDDTSENFAELLSGLTLAVENTSEEVLPVVMETLSQAKRSLNEISAVAVAIGPGSFTGARTGIATALGLMGGETRRVFGVSTLAARAQLLLESAPPANSGVRNSCQLLVPILRANPREFFYAVYVECLDLDDDLPLVPGEPTLLWRKLTAPSGVSSCSGVIRTLREIHPCGVLEEATLAAGLTLALPWASPVVVTDVGEPLLEGINTAQLVGRAALVGQERYRGITTPLYGKRVNALTLAERGLFPQLAGSKETSQKGN